MLSVPYMTLILTSDHSIAAEAFVTLATTDPYCMGAIVVARSLRRHGTTRSIVVMVTPNVSEQSRLSLKNVFDEVIMVDVMDSEDPLHLALLRRPELGITFTKIHCWTLTQYSKCVFLDADTLVLCNVDELFERDELSAAPDPGWPDCFNSGVFVFIPSLHTHTRLLNHTLLHGSFDGGDQGLLNSFFSSWPVEDISKHLPFVYNLSASSFYTYLPAFQQFGHNAKIVHFLGVLKPWSSRNQRDDSHSHTMEQFVSLWWTEYLSFPTMSLPGPQSSQDCEKPKPVQEQDVKKTFRETLDNSDTLLAHFSLRSKMLHSPSEPKTCSHTDNTLLEEDSGTPKRTATQDDPPFGAEELKGRDGTSDTGTHPEPDELMAASYQMRSTRFQLYRSPSFQCGPARSGSLLLCSAFCFSITLIPGLCWFQIMTLGSYRFCHYIYCCNTLLQVIRNTFQY